jgi:hypothetical protein
MEVSGSGERDRIHYMGALNNRFNCYMVIAQLTCLYVIAHIYMYTETHVSMHTCL